MHRLRRSSSRQGTSARSIRLGAIVGLVASCATARVENAEPEREALVPRPGRVIVFDFDTGASDVRVAHTARRAARRTIGLSVENEALLAEAVADALARRLVEDVRALGRPAERAIGVSPPAENDVVIQGRFVRIDEGSPVKRFVIGFGAGATELRTQVDVFHVTARGWQPMTHFETVAEGARLPGAAFGVAGGAAAGMAATSAVVSAGIGAVREAHASIDADARRTAEQITRKVAEIKSAQRW